MSFIIQAAASGGTITAQAATAMTGNKPVIVNANGTVDEVGLVVPAGFTQSATSTTNSLANSNAGNCNAISIGSNTFVIVGRQNTTLYPMIVAGTVSGNTFTWGTPAVIESLACGLQMGIAYDSVNQKVVVGYSTSGSGQRAVVATITGTTVSLGTIATADATGSTSPVTVVYDSTNQKIAYFYGVPGAGSQNYARVGTVSGTSISFGSSTQINTVGSVTYTRARGTFDSANGNVILVGAETSTRISSTVCTISGTSISVGTTQQIVTGNFQATYGPNFDICYHAGQQRIVVSYAAIGANNNFAVAGQVSGTSISYGSAVTVDTTQQYESISCCYDSVDQAILFLCNDSSLAKVNSAVLSGSTITLNYATAQTYSTFGAPSVLMYNASLNQTYVARTPIPGGTPSISVSYYVTLAAAFSTNLTSENFIGFSNRAYAAGETATIEIIGAVNDGQSGLTPGQSYYVQLNGTLGLSPASPSVFAGTAFATTKLIVKG